MSDILHSKLKFGNYDFVSDHHVLFRVTSTQIHDDLNRIDFNI
jgi:hypothetical protein